MTPEPTAHLVDGLPGGAVDTVRRRLSGAYTVDPWGFDAEVAGWAATVSRLRWNPDVEGVEHVPLHGPALLVANPVPLSLAPVAAALALGQATGRPVRFTGVPDVEPAATALRRLGGVLDHPVEVAGLLRDGQLVLVWCTGGIVARPRVGPARPGLLAAAVTNAVPVVPVALQAARLGRRLHLRLGRPIPVESPQRGPLAAADAADAACAAVEELLEDRPHLVRP